MADEDTLMEGTITLFCLVQGDSKQNTFAVRTGNGFVSEFKETIKEKKKNTFAKIDADQLILWHVSIPMDNNTDTILTGLKLENNDENDIWELDPSDDIFDVYPNPAKTYIHCIIQAPVTATPPNKGSYKNITSPFAEGRDNLCFISNKRLALFDRWMTENPVCLLRSPPRSGKTTLADILQEHLQKKGRNVVFISMLEIETFRGEKNLKSFDLYWKKRTGMTWTQCASCKEPTDVLIDEAQILFKFVKFFWAKIKFLMQPAGRNPYLRILFLSIYGDGPGTPIDFEFTLGLDNLRLLQNEYKTLVDQFIDLSKTNGLTITIPNTVRDAIFNMTLGHPGIIRRILTFLQYQHQLGLQDTASMLRFLVSSGFQNGIQEIRALSWIKTRTFRQDETRFLRKALNEMDNQSTFPVEKNNEITQQIVINFKRSGIVTQTDNIVSGRLQFAAPLVRVILGQRLFSTPVSLSGLPRAEDFAEFLTLSISRLRPSKLKAFLSKSGIESNLYKRAWQMEWYRAARMALPRGASISLDVGPIFGSTGFLDFYVNTGLEWGVELLREGDRMVEHVRYFVEEGEYKDIPLKQWAIVDFRHKSKKLKSARFNFWYVLYDDHYSTVTIKRMGCEDVQLILGEDKEEENNSKEQKDKKDNINYYKKFVRESFKEGSEMTIDG